MDEHELTSVYQTNANFGIDHKENVNHKRR